MKNILVTGGAGFIGSYIVDELINKGYNVRIFDNLDKQVHKEGLPPDYLNKDAEFIKGDVRDYDAFKDALKGIDAVFHKASAVGVGQSQYEIKKFMDVNIGGTANLLDAVVNERYPIEKIIVAASMSSYGEGAYFCPDCYEVRPSLRKLDQVKEGEWELFCPNCHDSVSPVATKETEHQNANSIYAITKKNQEEVVMNIGATYNIPVVSLRYFNVYGPRQSLSNPYTGVAAIFMSRIKNNNQPVIYEDGGQTRDFVSVHDVVQANMQALKRAQANYQIFNIGSGKANSIKSVAMMLARLYSSSIEPSITHKFRKGDVRHCFADISRAKDLLGFEPEISFEEGLKELIKWSDETEATDMFETAANQLKDKGLVIC